MATLGGFYLNPHETQYHRSARLTSMGCTPTTGANGANASTGGRVALNGDQVLAKVAHSEETNPATAGWSLEDLGLAMHRSGVPYDVRSGQGWAAMGAALDSGHYVSAQGDSDQFGNATCSGAFDGDHDLGVHPATRVVNGLRQHWIDDPICPAGRWEFDYIIRRYATKLSAGIRFSVFTTAVPKVAAAPVPIVVTLRYGGRRLTPRQVKRIAVPAGQRAIVRLRPTRAASAVRTMANGSLFTAYQVTTTGQLLAGSRRWYGDRTGTRWLHVTAF